MLVVFTVGLLLFFLVRRGDPPEWRGSKVGPTAAEIEEFAQLWERSVKNPLVEDEVKRIEHIGYLLLPDLKMDSRLDGLRWVVQFGGTGFGIGLCNAAEYKEGMPVQWAKPLLQLSASYNPAPRGVFPPPQWTPGIKLDTFWLMAGDVEVISWINNKNDFKLALLWQIRFDVLARVGRATVSGDYH